MAWPAIGLGRLGTRSLGSKRQAWVKSLIWGLGLGSRVRFWGFGQNHPSGRFWLKFRTNRPVQGFRALGLDLGQNLTILLKNRGFCRFWAQSLGKMPGFWSQILGIGLGFGPKIRTFCPDFGDFWPNLA